MVKLERSYPKPPSLAKKVSYNSQDVYTSLRKMQNDKCYICNKKKVDLEVEHLNPHKNGKHIELKFNWDNLFLACKHCNSIKNREVYDYSIIDCCQVDPEQVLKFICNKDEIKVESIVQEDNMVNCTATLITEVFNKTNTGGRELSCEIRVDALKEEMNVLYDATLEHVEQPSKFTLERLKILLQKESEFAAFKRNYVRHNDVLYARLKELVE